jgi:hypothetical protein
MTLPGTVISAAPGVLGFDTDGIVTPAAAALFVADGYRFCIRYVSRAEAQGPADLSASEALDILGSGLALSVVQHPRAAGWTPSRALGSQDGSRAAQHAVALGFPPGVNIWCDLEGVATATPAQAVIDHCNAWFDAVSASGYVPGVYVGADAILDGDALHRQLKFAHYWKSLSTVPDIAVRGYQLVQSDEHTAHGISIDNNKTQTDRLGGTIILLAPTAPETVTE